MNDSPTAAGSTPSDTPTTGLSRFAQKVLKRQNQPPAPTLFIGNLGFEATADSIRAMIEAHERIREAKERGRKQNAKLAAKTRSNKEDDSDSSNEGESDDRGEDVDKPEKEASLVKVRVGTFEDSGNCKG